MHDQIAALKQDLRSLQTALGLDLCARAGVRRGLLGLLGGMLASLCLALWMLGGGAPLPGMLLYLGLLQAVVVIKAVGYSRGAASSPETEREAGFYGRYYFCGAALLACFYFWGRRQGIELPILYAAVVVIAGMWYTFYGISAPARAVSLGGAVPLMIGGVTLPQAGDLSQMFCWLGIIGAIGCVFEAALLCLGSRQTGGAATPPAAMPSSVAHQPESSMPVHAVH